MIKNTVNFFSVCVCVCAQTYPDVLQYSLTIADQNYTLYLEKNK